MGTIRAPTAAAERDVPAILSAPRHEANPVSREATTRRRRVARRRGREHPRDDVEAPERQDDTEEMLLSRTQEVLEGVFHLYESTSWEGKTMAGAVRGTHGINMDNSAANIARRVRKKVQKK